MKTQVRETLLKEREEEIKTMKRGVDEGRRARLWAQSAMVVNPGLSSRQLILQQSLHASTDDRQADVPCILGKYIIDRDLWNAVFIFAVKAHLCALLDRAGRGDGDKQ